MSRVHDALRRAQQQGQPASPKQQPSFPVSAALRAAQLAGSLEPVNTLSGVEAPEQENAVATTTAVLPEEFVVSPDLLTQVRTLPMQLKAGSPLIDARKPYEAPAEEFRSLRTRLNHLQNQQPIHSIVVSSPSPAEGKSFTAANLALAQAQLDNNPTLLCDFDLRRPTVHGHFNLERTPGVTDFLMGKAALHEIIYQMADTNLYIMPAGSAIINPLELLNLPEVGGLIQELPRLFNWVILDTPPLLYAADASLLATLCDGTVMVVRIGSTTIDSVTRAMQSLCDNNIIGTVVNGARRGELYNKYTYYHSHYQRELDNAAAAEEQS